jgi:hypothetical protein
VYCSESGEFVIPTRKLTLREAIAEDRAMMNSLYRWIPIFTVTAMCLVTAACSADSDTDETASDQAASEYGTDGAVEPTEGPGEDEMAEGGDEPATAETGGEHDEAGEGREAGEHAGSESGGEHGGGEHDEGGAGEGEESGVYVGVTKTWDSEQNGARLVLKFYPDRGVFFGTVENTTGGMLCAVRGEVHLDSGTELGPTERMDVEPGQTVEVALSTGGKAFESWTAHSEMSACGG